MTEPRLLKCLTKIDLIVDHLINLENKLNTRCSRYAACVNSLVLNTIIKYANGYPLTLTEILDMKDKLSQMTNIERTHEAFNLAISHLNEKPVLNTYDLNRKELFYYELFIEAESQTKLKEFDNSPSTTIELYKTVYALAVTFCDEQFVRYLEIEKSSLVKP